MDIKSKYKEWCKLTKRNGHILIGSMNDFFDWYASQFKSGERREQKEEEIEDAFINRLWEEFNRRGIDTSNWDGDCGPEEAIVSGVIGYAESQRQDKEWVSVEERLPDIEERVLLNVRSLGDNFSAIGRRKANNFYYLDKGTMLRMSLISSPGITHPVIIYFSLLCENEIYRIFKSDKPMEEITHWMPLPHPPKSKEV